MSRTPNQTLRTNTQDFVSATSYILGTDAQDFSVTIYYIEQAMKEKDHQALGDLFCKLREQVDLLEEECEEALK
jgi:hypothetical protein